jgi:hypothetical protein
MSLSDLFPSQVKLYAVTGLALCVVATIGWLLIARANLRAELAESRAQNAAYIAQNDAFKASAQRQNDAIAALQAEAEVRAEAAQKAAQAAQARAEAYQAKAAALSRRKPSAPDACAAADALFNDYLRGQK